MKLNFIKNLLLSILIISLYSCKETDRKIKNSEITLNWSNFKETENLNGIKMQSISDSLFIPSTMYIVGDYLFVSERTSGAIMHIANIRDNKYLGMYGNRGTGPGEVLNSWKFFSPDNKTIGIFDPELGKALTYNIDTILQDNRHNHEYIHEGMLHSNGATIQGNEMYYLNSLTQPEARLYSFNLKETGKTGKKGSIPELDKPYPGLTPLEESITTSYAQLTNRGEIFVISYYNIPLVTIYNLDKGKDLSISGLDKMPPPELFGELRYFISTFVSEKYIYLLYIENKTEFDYTTSTILVLDHEGNPVNKFLLDMEIFQLAVQQDSTIYGLTEDYFIVKFEMN